MLEANAKAVATGIDNKDPILSRASGRTFYNISPLTFTTVTSDHEYVAENLRSYILGFSANVRDIIDKFGFDGQIDKLVERSRARWSRPSADTSNS